MQLPKRASDNAIAVQVEKGKTYYWCACGLSKQQPFCDGSHGTTGYNAKAYTAEKDETVYFCGCKQTKNSPLCDGSHSR